MSPILFPFFVGNEGIKKLNDKKNPTLFSEDPIEVDLSRQSVDS